MARPGAPAARVPTLDHVLAELKSLASEKNRAGMAHYGINTDRAFGISMATLKPIARRLGRDHALALGLWRSGWHEARLLAVLVDEPARVTRRQMDSWVAAFDSWDICDQACSKLFVRTPHAAEAIRRWAADDREFVRRAGFALIAAAAVNRKAFSDDQLAAMLPLVAARAGDRRNFVKKAVNWALRQIGKHSPALHRPALTLAEKLAASDDPAARWIGKDAVRELTDPLQRARIARRG